jgi:hypothetical protein
VAKRRAFLATLFAVAAVAVSFVVVPSASATTASFSGTVTDSSGNTPLSGIQVAAFEYNSSSGAYITSFTTTTDAQGDYSFSALPSNIYGIQAHDPALHYATLEYDNESPYYQPDYIQYSGGTIPNLDFYMPVAAHIQGTVSGVPSGDLAAGDVIAEVEVLDYSNGDPVWFETGDNWPVAANGTYDIGDLPPDDYRVLFQYAAPTGRAIVPSAEVAPLEGETLTNVDVTMPTPTIHGGLAPLPPYRVLDTRIGLGAAAGAVAAGGTITLQVTGVGGVPRTGVSAVVLNVTVAGSSRAGYITAYPADADTRPTASNLNFVPGQLVPNLVVVPVSADGAVNLYNGSTGATQLVADVAGYYVSGTPTAPGAFGALPPARVLDTRIGVGAPVGAVASNGVLPLQVTGHDGVPASGVSAVVLNVTVAGSTGAGYITAYPDGTTRPTASNLNFVPGQLVPNLVVVPVGPGGVVDLYNGSPGATQLVADVAGYYLEGDPAAPGAFGALPPARVLDTRYGIGAAVGAVGPGGTLTLQVTGNGGVPSGGHVAAVVLNVTVAGSNGAGYITAYPADAPSRPTASNLNFVPNQLVPNLVVVPVSADGKIKLYNGSSGSTQLVADVAGWIYGG